MPREKSKKKSKVEIWSERVQTLPTSFYENGEWIKSPSLNDLLKNMTRSISYLQNKVTDLALIVGKHKGSATLSGGGKNKKIDSSDIIALRRRVNQEMEFISKIVEFYKITRAVTHKSISQLCWVDDDLINFFKNAKDEDGKSVFGDVYEIVRPENGDIESMVMRFISEKRRMMLSIEAIGKKIKQEIKDGLHEKDGLSKAKYKNKWVKKLMKTDGYKPKDFVAPYEIPKADSTRHAFDKTEKDLVETVFANGNWCTQGAVDAMLNMYMSMNKLNKKIGNKKSSEATPRIVFDDYMRDTFGKLTYPDTVKKSGKHKAGEDIFTEEEMADSGKTYGIQYLSFVQKIHAAFVRNYSDFKPNKEGKFENGENKKIFEEYNEKQNAKFLRKINKSIKAAIETRCYYKEKSNLEDKISKKKEKRKTKKASKKTPEKKKASKKDESSSSEDEDSGSSSED